MKAFGVQFEMMDQRFHRALHFRTFGWHDLAIVAGDRAFGHFLQALFHDARRLPDFLDTNHEAVVAIAARADGHVEVHLRINVIGLRLAQIPCNARPADHRAREAPFNRIVLRHDPDIDIALLEDAVVRNERNRIVEQPR